MFWGLRVLLNQIHLQLLVALDVSSCGLESIVKSDSSPTKTFLVASPVELESIVKSDSSPTLFGGDVGHYALESIVKSDSSPTFTTSS